MRNSSEGSDSVGKILFNFDWWVLLRVPISPKQSENSDRNEFYFDSTLRILLIGFRFSHNSNPRMGTNFVSTTRKDMLNSLLFLF